MRLCSMYSRSEPFAVSWCGCGPLAIEFEILSPLHCSSNEATNPRVVFSVFLVAHTRGTLSTTCISWLAHTYHDRPCAPHSRAVQWRSSRCTDSSPKHRTTLTCCMCHRTTPTCCIYTLIHILSHNSSASPCLISAVLLAPGGVRLMLALQAYSERWTGGHTRLRVLHESWW